MPVGADLAAVLRRRKGRGGGGGSQDGKKLLLPEGKEGEGLGEGKRRRVFHMSAASAIG